MVLSVDESLLPIVVVCVGVTLPDKSNLITFSVACIVKGRMFWLLVWSEVVTHQF